MWAKVVMMGIEKAGMGVIVIVGWRDVGIGYLISGKSVMMVIQLMAMVVLLFAKKNSVAIHD